LACARELRERFTEAVSHLQPAGPNLTRITASIGVAIAHHTAPLGGVLLSLQRAERSAKEKYGRAALCVHMLKRSGEEIRIGTRWSHDGASLVKRAEDAIDLLYRDFITMKFPVALAAEASALSPLPTDARASEIKRLAKRHKGKNFEQGPVAAFAD